MLIPSDPFLFSVVIPTYNRPERLLKCLEALTQQTLSTDCWEVIIVDDGSQESLESVAATVRSHIQIHLIRQSNTGPATARNTGAANASGRYLVFTDDDCQPLPDWLEQFARKFEQKTEGLIGGHTLNALPQNIYSTASQLLIDYLYKYYNSPPREATFFASNNFAAPREIYQKLGGFDTSFPLAAGEDREFCDRWLQHGYSMDYASEAQINHAHELTLRSFWRQHFNYGRGAFHFHQVRAKRDAGKIEVEPLSFYSNLLIYPFLQETHKSKLLLSGLFVLSQVANLMGFFWERFNQLSEPTPPKRLAAKEEEVQLKAEKIPSERS
ncbi:MAG: glycosyltransferase [Leptolyngbyaceae cyanobacterium MO_188.B28]|nr:glycosyltransferase [Leptolyngbyaceae cyanobacterium MO_188.B28]